jgi:hypothetical protein
LEEIAPPEDYGQKKSMYFIKERMEFEKRNNIVKKDGNDEEATRRNMSNKIGIERFNELQEDFT